MLQCLIIQVAMFSRFKPRNWRAQLKPPGWFTHEEGVHIVDMSETSIGLLTRSDIHRGSRVRVTLLNGSPDHRLRLCGVVQIACPDSNGLQRIDVKFDDLTARAREMIRALRAD